MKVIKLDATPSTNSYLKEWALENPDANEVVVWTENQTQGRGQQGSSWTSNVGESLACSVLKRFSSVDVSLLPKLQLGMAIAVFEALKSLGVHDVQLKWPNDILSDSKKLGGILIENRWQGSQELVSVVGVGINVNQSKFPELPQATSMYLQSRKSYAITHVFEGVSSQVMSLLKSLESQSFEELKQRYEQHLFRKDIVSTFETSDETLFQGTIKGVTETGSLIVQDNHGTLRNFQHKEIKLQY
ncbi:MAG: biotin--[acetyl-CoA-carboxylase] ligase [Flavobacteriaceae bacterium]|nr:biotin--[acetyl-CoA-carboxylase] ligase [Flavobacteriaceae bacterium]